MPSLQSGGHKPKRSPASIRRITAHVVECLERRTLLNATLTSAISPIGVAPSGAATTINLSQHFSDPKVPGTLVDVTTPLGVIPVALTDSTTPNTVANFLKYINTPSEYQGTVIHRSVPGFVIQGGGYTASGSPIATFGQINGESGHQSNVAGTIAMALSNGPNSATSQWFINLGNNASALDGTTDGGPFTVFGNVIYNGMSVANAIAALQVVNDSQNPPGTAGSPPANIWSQLPVLSSYTGTSTPTSVSPSDLVTNTYSIAQPLTYTATSDNPSLVNPTVSGSNLTLNYGTGTGTTQIHVTAKDIANNTASTTFTVGVGIQNVTVGANGVVIVRYRDSRGVLGNVALTGKGTATVALIGTGLKTGKNINGVVTVTGRADSVSITANGTTASTVLTIFGSGHRALQFASLSITGALGMLNAPSVSLSGALTSTGAIHDLELGDVKGGTLTIGGGPGAIVHLGNANNENLFSYANILSLTADSWTGTSQINAPFIRSAQIGNAFDASLVVNTVGTFTAGSITGSTWSVPGKVEQLNVQNLKNWTANLGSAGRIIAAGTVDSSTLHTTNNIGFFASTGMTNSNVYAGANNLTGGLPAVTGDFTSSARIASFTVNGRFVNSNVAAQTLSKIDLGTVQTSNGAKPFGIAAHSIPDLLLTIGAKKIHVRKLTNEAQITAALSKNHVSAQDLVIRLI